MINNDVNDIVEAITNKIEVVQIFLFGSYAYGDPNEYSDYDFYIVVSDNKEKITDIIIKINKIVSKFTIIKPIDIISGKYSDFENQKVLPIIERTIYKKGVLLYG